jgi:hypothetical protein
LETLPQSSPSDERNDRAQPVGILGVIVLISEKIEVFRIITVYLKTVLIQTLVVSST